MFFQCIKPEENHPKIKTFYKLLTNRTRSCIKFEEYKNIHQREQCTLNPRTVDPAVMQIVNRRNKRTFKHTFIINPKRGLYAPSDKKP